MPHLPAGTVTFLYTDIEESTKRWEREPGVMKAAVERHDAILREAIASGGGTIFRTMGDAFCAVFSTAPAALETALAAQRLLMSEKWDERVGVLKVRMALHTGIGEVRDGDYVGLPLNRIARLLSAGYGGQLLISQATYDLVRDTLPLDVEVRDLGEHRLKDLQRPERVFQLATPDLLSRFPPLRTLDNRPNNLPVQRSPLIGREKELAAVQRLLLRDAVNMVTLVGPGGVGKTRLALQVAAEVIEHFRDGVFFVALTPITDAELVLPAIAQSLGVKEIPNQPLAQSLKHHLVDKQLLLVLDNCDRLLDAAPAVSDLLSQAPQVKALATSREALHLYSEQLFPVPPLALPDKKKILPIDSMSQYEAVRLFIERARAVRPDFAVTNDNAPAVADICARLDGLPLAIELAAARIAILSPHAMLARLQSRLKLLTGGARDLPARQQTLRGAIEWSHELLDAGEQMLFRRLSIFSGSFSLEAVEAICVGGVEYSQPSSGRFSGSTAPGSPPLTPLSTDILDGVMSLAGKSLLRQVDTENGETRFALLETIREYALEKLSESGEAGNLHTLHAAYYLTGFSNPEVMYGIQPDTAQRVRLDSDNMWSALWWSIEQEDLLIAVLAGPSAVWLSMVQNAFTEIRKWLQAVLKLSSNTHRPNEQLRGCALFMTGYVDFMQGNYTAARAHLRESITIVRKLGVKAILAQALHTAGMSAQFQNDYAVARSDLEESITLFREEGYTSGLGVALFSLGDVALAEGKDEEARGLYEESIAAYGSGKNDLGVTFPLISLGRLAWLQGDYERARSLVVRGVQIRRDYGASWALAIALDSLSEVARCQGKFQESAALAEEAMALYREAEDRSGIAWSLYNLAYAAYHEREYEKAAGLFREALTLRREQDNKDGITLCTAVLARVTGVLGDIEKAARLYGAVEHMIAWSGVRMSPFDRADHEQNRTVVRSQMGEGSFTAEWDKGCALTVDQAVAYALGEAA